jgi:hypothetical protein
LVGDRSNFESELSELRAEIANLANLPALSPEFVTWLSKLFGLVKECFGPDSDEMGQLRAISPELPSEFYDSISARIDALGLDRETTNQLLTGLNRDVPQAIFRQRLYGYDDLIASMIFSLRSAGSS